MALFDCKFSGYLGILYRKYPKSELSGTQHIKQLNVSVISRMQTKQNTISNYTRFNEINVFVLILRETKMVIVGLKPKKCPLNGVQFECVMT